MTLGERKISADREEDVRSVEEIIREIIALGYKPRDVIEEANRLGGTDQESAAELLSIAGEMR